MNLSDTSIEATPTKTNRSALQYSPRDELDLSRSNSSQADSIVSLTARENAQLRTENARLEQENDRLEQENVHLKKELARLNGTNLQERRCLKPWSQLGRERKRRLLKDILGTVQNVADHYETSVICVSANIMYRGAFAVKRYDILKIARKIEVFATSSLLLLLFLSSWILWNSQRMSCASSPQVQILVDAISLLKCGEIFYLLFAPLSMSAVFTCAAQLSRLSPN